jgi:hypothetical protein
MMHTDKPVNYYCILFRLAKNFVPFSAVFLGVLCLEFLSLLHLFLNILLLQQWLVEVEVLFCLPG